MTDGPDAALALAKTAAKGQSVAISGGAGVARQYIAAGLVDEILIHRVRVFLGDGVRLFESPGLLTVKLTQVRVIEAPGVTHLTYRVTR